MNKEKKMKVSYYSGLFLILLLAIGAGWISGDLRYYVNIPGLLFVSGACIGTLLCNFGLHGSLSAILVLFSPTKSTATGFRKSAAKTVILSGLFGGLFFLIMGVIAALSSLDDLSKIGPSLATGFTSLLYGSFFALIMVPAYI
jgi:flagellar motor component MotA